MNREIKFRAWEEECNFMNDQVRIIVNPFGCGETYYQVTDATNWIDVPRHHVMQWTGLKDKNGVEIFEGDLVRGMHDFGPAGFSELTSVVFFDEVVGYQWEYRLLSDLEVIGNIYENPELLKER